MELGSRNGRIAATVFLCLSVGIAGLRVRQHIAAGERTRQEVKRTMSSEAANALAATAAAPAGSAAQIRPARDPFRRVANPAGTRGAAGNPSEPPPPLLLQGIRGGAHPAACLDGQVARTGEKVNGWVVEEITEDHVRIRSASGAVRVLEAP